MVDMIHVSAHAYVEFIVLFKFQKISGDSSKKNLNISSSSLIIGTAQK